ncbi:hypothetical protein HAL07_11210 [Helicobacter ailurogastricus]|uniref:Uncharacterized protein n=1 Tax=Helicobacter ailurogastricus TaxID=1578720 RepID=A0A0K2XZX9_9HELI|nr:hypothetical protein HAL07_11210 [Helicobacter ailurogastricus]
MDTHLKDLTRNVLMIAKVSAIFKFCMWRVIALFRLNL